MSTRYNIHCETCKKVLDIDWGNDSNTPLNMIKFWEIIKPVCKALVSQGSWPIYYIDDAYGYGDLSLPFLSEHDGHDLRVFDEYGREVTQSENLPIT